MKFSEKQVGYLLVLPALIIILVIAIWPVARSFWLSLYDIRLNDPTKTEIHHSAGIDMERYVNTMPLLIKLLDKEMKQATGEAKDQLLRISTEVQGLREALNNEQQVAQRYEQVDELLYEFKPIPEELKYAEIDNEKAEQIKILLQEMRTEFIQLDNADLLNNADGLIGLVDGFQSSLIEPNFVGLAAYKYFLKDKRMWASLWNTLIFTLISVVIELALGLWIAMLIHKQFKGRGLVRAAVLIPWAIPTVISAMMWKFLYDGQYGVVAKLFDVVGLAPDMGALLSTKFGAMFSIIFADVWKTTPFMALLLLAGLQIIPGSLYESARVDGASKFQQFFRITLPLLKSAMLVALLFRTLDAFRVFDLIYVLTGGGPANSTESISLYAYKTMFAQMNFGAGSAISVIVFLCVALISIGYIKILGADLIGEGNAR